MIDSKELMENNIVIDSKGYKMVILSFSKKSGQCSGYFPQLNDYGSEYIKDLQTILLTLDILKTIEQAKRNEISIITPQYLIELGKNRRLSITAETGNNYIFIQEYNENDYRVIEDLVCIFNGDYDGKLYLHKLQNIYRILTGKELTFNN